MSSLNLVNPKAEMARKRQATAINVGAATGMQDVLKSNLGTLGGSRRASAPSLTAAANGQVLAERSKCWSAAPARSS